MAINKKYLHNVQTSLIIRAMEQVYRESGNGGRFEGPLVSGQGKLGPAFPEDENSHDLAFS